MSNAKPGNEHFVATTNPSRKSPRFHQPWCRWVPLDLASAIARGGWIELFSHEEATAAGYKTCTTCNP